MLRIRLPLAMLVTALMAVPPLAAQETPIAGSFVLDHQASDDLEAVVDEGVELLESWWWRPFARGRLEDRNRPYAWTRIVPRDGGVGLETDVWSLEIPWDGGVEDWERAKGDLVDVGAAVEGRLLRVVFQGEEGRRTDVYRLADGGETLIVDVTITGERLREPLAYQLVYRREDPGATP